MAESLYSDESLFISEDITPAEGGDFGDDFGDDFDNIEP